MPEILPTINAEPPQGIQSILDTGYIWNQDVANDLIDKVNELLEKLEGLKSRILPYSELEFPVVQYTPCFLNDSVYVAAQDIEEQEEFDPDKWIEIAKKGAQYTAGENITIEDNVISATDTTYSAGEGISIDENNVISNTQTSAEWGNISGDIEDQADLVAKFGTVDTQITGVSNSLNAEVVARQAADAQHAEAISDLGQALEELEDVVDTKASKASVDVIEGKIPSTATAQNQLADKDFVNSSIQNMAANYITSSTTGDPFATRAALVAGPWYYKGAAKAPTNNDYALVEADETHDDLTSRYMYDGTQWVWQYVLNDTKFTQAQLDAINSTITKNKLDAIEGDISDIQGEIATYGDIVTHDADEFATPSDVSSAVSTHDSDTTAHSDIRAEVAEKITNPSGGTTGQILTKTASGEEWADAGTGLPDPTGHSGEFLTNDGTDASWAAVNAMEIIDWEA